MATVYVSKTATNGLSVGDDSRTYAQAQNMATPWLTISKASTSSVNGDIVLANDGIYVENTSGIGHLQPSKAVTIEAVNPYQVTIQAASGTGRVVYFSSAIASPGPTLGKIVVDAQRTQDRCLYTNGANGYTINGTSFKDSLVYYIHTATPAASSVHTINEFITSNSGLMTSGSGFYFYSIANSTTIDINGPGTLNYSSNNSGSFGGIYVGGVTGGSSSLSVGNGVDINISSTSGNPLLLGVYSSGVSTVDIHPSSISFSGTNAAVVGVQVVNHSMISSAANIHDITLQTDNPLGIGVGILLGDSTTPSVANKTTGIVSGNKAHNFNKAIVTGWVTSVEVCRNETFDCWWHLLAYLTTNSIFHHNIADRATSSATAELFLDEGGTSNTWVNNLIISGDASYGAAAFGTRSLYTSPFTHTTGLIFENNIIFISNVRAYFSLGTGDSATEISNNCYYGSTATTNLFSYNGTNYDTIEGWKVVNGSTEMLDDPKFVSSTDFHLQLNSPCLGTGTAIPEITKDFEGNPLFPPYNIGPYGLADGALGVAPVVNDGAPRNNITRLTGTSTAIDPAGTYQFDDTNAWRIVTGWTAGTANFAFDADGVPIPFTGQQLIDAGIGPRLYCGSRGIAGYTEDQDAASNAKIIRTLKVPTYIDTLYYSDFQEMDWSATSE